MNYLVADNVSKRFGDILLFQHISLSVNQGEKIAMVGRNGSGKSTLIKCMAGMMPIDEGYVNLNPKIRVGYLDQDPDLDEQKTIRALVFDDENPVARVNNEYEKAVHEGADSEKMQQLIEKMETLNAWDFEGKVKNVLGKLGIHELDTRIATLSGGQKKRVALGQVLLSGPDLLILDEPTNHLDLEAIEWLEGYLTASNVTILMVTHDRYFLDNVTNTVLELDNNHIYRYQGNYAYFLEKKEEREQVEQAELEKTQKLFKKELEWMKRQPKARGTKAKSRVDNVEKLREKASQDYSKDNMEINVKASRQGKKILEVSGLKKQYEGHVLVDQFSYLFKRKDRVGVVGKNGIGKTTFLHLLTARVEPDEGTITYGYNTKIGYFTQEADNVKPENRVIDEVKNIAEIITLGNGEQVSASRFLKQFLFTPKMQYNYVSRLSGGERKRLQLLKILVANPNFLILDEPTNDLDIDSLNILEDFLEKYEGCLIIVSHDRYFMDKLVDHLFVFEGNGVIRDFPGNYSDYRLWKDEQEKEEKKQVEKTQQAQDSHQNSVNKTGDQKSTKSKTPGKLSYKQQKKLDDLEQEISSLEQERDTLNEKFHEGIADNDELIACSNRLQEINRQLEEKTNRWFELSE